MAYNTNSKHEEEEEEATNDYSSYWQSIPDPPDPPTPVDNNIKVSTDNSNGDDNDIKVSEVEPRRHNRKKKKNAFRDVTNSAATATADNNNKPADDDDGGIDKCVATLRSIGEGGINEKKSSKKSKRRKRRKSLLLPSDEVGDTLLPPLAASSIDNNQKSTELSSINNNNSYNKQVLTQLVRDYCQLPNEERINSTQSKQIETLSSYPMPGKIMPFMNDTTTNSKHEFLLRVQPIVQEMEIKKKRDIQETKLATQCEVQKERGGFCYYDINSGQQVMPEEYNIRYSQMVDEQRKKRRLVVNEDENDVDGVSEKKKEKELVNVNQTEMNHNHNKHEETHDNNNFKDNEQEPKNADDSNMEIDESMEDSMNMSHDDSIMSRGKEEEDKQCPEKTAKSSPLDNLSTEEKVQGTTDESQSQPASNDTSNPLSQMPPSNDPRVIAARKTLFTAIDTALANYSAKILAIEAADNKGSATSS